MFRTKIICNEYAVLTGETKPFWVECASARQNSSIQTVAKFLAVVYNTFTVLGGELAVPCYLQSATVGLKVAGGFSRGKQASARSVDTKVLCNVKL